MYGIGSVIDCQRVFDAIEGEFAVGNTVGVASDDGPERRTIDKIFLQAIEAEHNVFQLPLFVRNLQGSDDAAKIARAHF